jgi:hypothetical protein
MSTSETVATSEYCQHQIRWHSENIVNIRYCSPLRILCQHQVLYTPQYAVNIRKFSPLRIMSTILSTSETVAPQNNFNLKYCSPSEYRQHQILLSSQNIVNIRYCSPHRVLSISETVVPQNTINMKYCSPLRILSTSDTVAPSEYCLHQIL